MQSPVVRNYDGFLGGNDAAAISLELWLKTVAKLMSAAHRRSTRMICTHHGANGLGEGGGVQPRHGTISQDLGFQGPRQPVRLGKRR